METGKLTLSLLLTFLSTSVYAATPGAFVGLGLGYAGIDTPSRNVFSKATPATGDTITRVTKTKNDVGGLGGFIYTGYNFSKYFGVEGSFNQYADSEYANEQCSGDPSACNLTKADSDITFKAHAFNLVTKAYLPLSEHFEFIGRAGLSIVKQKVEYDHNTNDSSFNIPVNSNIATPALGTKTLNKVRPTIGIGFGYNIDNNLGLSVSWNTIFGHGNIKSDTTAMPDLSLYSLNFTYNFA